MTMGTLSLQAASALARLWSVVYRGSTADSKQVKATDYQDLVTRGTLTTETEMITNTTSNNRNAFYAFVCCSSTKPENAPNYSSPAVSLGVTGDKDIGIGTMQWRLDTLGRH